jgi:hypothetical protein
MRTQEWKPGCHLAQFLLPHEQHRADTTYEEAASPGQTMIAGFEIQNDDICSKQVWRLARAVE